MKLQEGEEVLIKLHPEPKILVIWFFTNCFGLVILGIVFGFLFFSIYSEMFEKGLKEMFHSMAAAGVKAIVTGLVILTLQFIYCVYLRRTYVYYITNRRCVFQGGIVRRVQHSVPYHKITDVEMSQNIIERMLGISSMGIFTPGTGSIYSSGRGNFGGRKPEIAFVGLKDNETPAETIATILSKYKATGQ